MIDFSFGDVVLVRFPFSDLKSSKQRPAVVLSSRAYNAVRADVIIIAVTSSLHPDPLRWDIILQDWKEAGLIKPSLLKPVLATVERRIVQRKLGRLTDNDLARLRGLLDSIIWD